MTALQRIIIENLLAGGSIAPAGARLRLRDPEGLPLLSITKHTFSKVRAKDLLRRHPRHNLWLIDKRKVRRLHGNDTVKRLYRGKARAPGKKAPPLDPAI